MSDRAAFMRAICERPDDDQPRLVFADWLDEQGDPLGEFIRVQCRPPEPTPGRPTRAAELLAAHREEWERDFRGRLGNPAGIELIDFQRGLVHGVNLAGVLDLVELGERLFQAAPVQYVGLLSCEPAEFLADWGPLRHLRRLFLDGLHLNPDASAAVLASPYLTGLRRLDMRNNYLGPAAAEALATNPALAGLRELDLRFCRGGGDAVAAALAATPRPPHLRVLDLGMSGIGPAGAQALAASGQLATVAVLDLHGNLIGAAGAEALLKSPHLGQLRELVLYNCGLDAVLRRGFVRRFGGRVVLD